LANRVDELTPEELENDVASHTSASLNVALSKFHPIEIRTPFSCHHVLDIVKALPPQLLVGSTKGSIHSKFFLRLCALKMGIPEKMCLREKVSFNEGGTGLKNAEPDSLAIKIAEETFTNDELKKFILTKKELVEQLGFGEDISVGNIDEIMRNNPEALAFLMMACRCGLENVAAGNAFRPDMSDPEEKITDGQLYTQDALVAYNSSPGSRMVKDETIYHR